MNANRRDCTDRTDRTDPRYTVVGWLFEFESYYCLKHQPSPPRDERCTKVYESDAVAEVCERCGVPLCPPSETKETTAPLGAEGIAS